MRNVEGGLEGRAVVGDGVEEGPEEGDDGVHGGVGEAGGWSSRGLKCYY